MACGSNIIVVDCGTRHRLVFLEIIVFELSKLEHDSLSIVFKFLKLRHDAVPIVFEFFKLEHDSVPIMLDFSKLKYDFPLPATSLVAPL